MARLLACELGPRGIRVNILSPGEYTFGRYICLISDLIQLWPCQDCVRPLASGGPSVSSVSDVFPARSHHAVPREGVIRSSQYLSGLVNSPRINLDPNTSRSGATSTLSVGSCPPRRELENSVDSEIIRLGKIHEMRGPAVWLASDASSYCSASVLRRAKLPRKLMMCPCSWFRVSNPL